MLRVLVELKTTVVCRIARLIRINRGQRVLTLVANQSMALHKNIAKSFGFMDFLNSRIYEYLKPIPSKSKHRAEWAREQLVLLKVSSC